jgi:hypothetical protein
MGMVPGDPIGTSVAFANVLATFGRTVREPFGKPFANRLLQAIKIGANATEKAIDRSTRRSPLCRTR